MSGIQAMDLPLKLTYVGEEEERTVLQRAAKFSLPALVNIGASYDIKLDRNEATYFHRLTPALNFTNHAFGVNQLTAGIEYGYKDMFQLRAGYAYQDGIFEYETRTSAYTGVSAGFTFEVPLSAESGNTFGLDYSYRHTNPFEGTHSFGVRLNLGGE